MKWLLNKLQAVLLFAIGVVGAIQCASHGAPNMSFMVFLASCFLTYASIVVNAD